MNARFAFLLGLLFSLALAVFAQTEKPATGSITGRITFKEQPMPGVIVTLENARPGPNAQQNPISAKTDSDGRYRLTGLAAGNYVVSPRAMAYVLPIDGGSWRPGKNINLSDGEAIENFDFTLVKGGVIAGTITDHLGRPVIGQRVKLTRVDERQPSRSFSYGNYRMYNTDDRGAYRLFGLPSGRYKVSLGEGKNDGSITIGRAGGFYRLTFYPGVTDEAEGKIIELTEGGEVSDIDFKVSAPEKTYEVKGRVIDGTSGAPLVGVNVAHGGLTPGQNSIGSYGYTTDVTSANGEFVLRGLTPGRYAAFPVANAAKEYYSDPTVFEVTNSDVEGLEVKAYRGASISGTVVVEGTNDPAVLKLLSQFYVSARVETTSLQSPGGSAPINPDGSFHLTGLRPGKARIFTPFSSSDAPLMLARIERDGAIIRDGIELTSGEQVKGVRIVMAYGSGVIRGQVNVAGGTLSPDTRLFVWANHAVTGESRSMQVDPRGRFVLGNLPPGEYKLSISQSSVSGASTTHTRPTVLQTVTVGMGEAAVTLTLDLSAKKEGQQ